MIPLTATEEAELMEMLRGRVDAILPRAIKLARQVDQLLRAAEGAADSGDVRMFALQLCLRHLGNNAADAFERAAPGPRNGAAVVHTMREVFEAAIDHLEHGVHPSDAPTIVVVSR